MAALEVSGKMLEPVTLKVSPARLAAGHIATVMATATATTVSFPVPPLREKQLLNLITTSPSDKCWADRPPIVGASCGLGLLGKKQAKMVRTGYLQQPAREP